ncbi:hypothetical protein MEN41_21950 [Dolichospermum sp. ST_con]|nr:hypothetical protein [Dolichospermum sp. ST_con]MDD1421408.1 hypothetical protein [Dolichospermum sp. ST_sed1]MDD1425563.1 hypothetical protein [Dolichospermum sp. ST_sed9]MDD1432320.1 hypothetical protein [Dolichospermum sp. ST_sed6]MDD1441540.1 hypothetical protein [Dolichospermum sp. ST_sed3]MDD1447382.1 hypothetical protein [Dolichospermum sp. ST_sed8]MDD1457219.1 hypothetical protein [Dolichospermum sp. ST_sed7]MDD1461542.1 hypothetical protein [Dolichospermum sp. ST_sed2]MDD1472442
MNKVDKSLLDTDILSEIIKRANPRIIAKADIYLNQFEKYTISAITKEGNRELLTGNKKHSFAPV